MKNLIFLIPLLPFIGFLINGLGRKALAKGVVSVVGCSTVLASFVISLYTFLHLDDLAGKQISKTARIVSQPVFDYFNFINVGSLKIPFAFQIDQLSS
ncbi:MAG: NADH-quinone oxidoreductase subunit L, partial [Chitinophagaceae bacterium]